MKSRSTFSLLSIASLATLIAVCALVASGCQSKSSNDKMKSKATEDSPEAVSPADFPPTAQTLDEYELDGKAFSLDGKPVKVRALSAIGDNRFPIFVGPSIIAYSSRRASLDRWQVFEVEFKRSDAKGVERRISFDAGDARPVAALGDRLIISTSSEDLKASDRVLERYRGLYGQKTEQKKDSVPGSANREAASAPTGKFDSELPRRLFLERLANARKGTEWVPLRSDSADQWSVSLDSAGKRGVATQKMNGDIAPRVYLVNISGKSREGFSWTLLNVAHPKGDTNPDTTAIKKTPIATARMMPDGQRIVWSDGAVLWTTNLRGQDAKRIGDDSLPAARDLAIEPSGQWIVFSTPSDSRGLNLMAVHNSGRCLRGLTELPGDEIEPSFSPDGQTLLFSQKQGDQSVVARMPFSTNGQVCQN